MTIILSENFRALFYAPFYAAHASGAFKRAGVEVELRPSSDPLEAARALRAGEVDVMWGGPLRVLIARDKDPGSDLVCFCDVVARDPFFVVGATPRPDFKFADLLSMKLATVSEVPTPWVCLQDDLRRAGVDPAKVDRITDKDMAENEAALREGRVDAVQVFQPYAENLVSTGAGHIWNAAAGRGLTAYTTLVTRRGVLEGRAEELACMIRGMDATLKWFAVTPSLEIVEVVQSFFPDVPRDLFAACIDRYRALELWGRDPVIRREGYERLHAAMRSSGILSRDIAFEDVVDTKLATRAIG
ncbi:ABC transporter substrate-binding protein [Reyranella sp.]|uniref:ABC transporter substrate-binding protein n=1 Tax=Reyranella sp. TaxID=1929291 RepID=UPI003BA9BB2C